MLAFLGGVVWEDMKLPMEYIINPVLVPPSSSASSTVSMGWSTWGWLATTMSAPASSIICAQFLNVSLTYSSYSFPICGRTTIISGSKAFALAISLFISSSSRGFTSQLSGTGMPLVP